MRICLVYDCLFPHTVGGAERWYRALAEALAAAGHEVTYLTRRQWPRGERPDLPRGTRVVVVSKAEPLYTPSGRRRIGEAVRFGAGVARHLRGHPGVYDAVHTASFPYFSVLGAHVVRRAEKRCEGKRGGGLSGKLVGARGDAGLEKHDGARVGVISKKRDEGPGAAAGRAGGSSAGRANESSTGCAREPSRAFALVVDWHEVWTREYWWEYLGVAGVVGWAVQRACARIEQRAFCFSRLQQRRLYTEGLRGEAIVLEGEYAGTKRPPAAPRRVEPLVVFAGRHIPEKRVPALVPAIAAARPHVAGLCAEILGDGPDTAEVRRLVAEHGLESVVHVRGFVAPEQVEDALDRAMCLVLPSRREGYGLIVVEASAAGTPSVVVRDPDNAATELIQDGVNGVIAGGAAPHELAAAIRRVYEAGPALRGSTAAWYERNALRLSLEHSLDTVVAAYGR